jgi:hypothetical protein
MQCPAVALLPAQCAHSMLAPRHTVCEVHLYIICTSCAKFGHCY